VKNWKNITPKGMPDFIRISLIEASPHKPGTAYVAAKHYQADDRRPYAYRTDDYGATWTKIVNGIPTHDFFQAIREDPKRPGLLYAGTEHGIYVSFDNGAEWQSLRLNLPDVQVADLVIEGDDLVIGTHGRAFYILDDISPLRQLSSNVLSGAAHLFTPHSVVRSVNRAGIDYWLAKEADAVTIDILDAKGAVVRSYVGSAEEEKKRAAGRGGAAAAADDGGGDEGGGGRGAVRPPARKAGGSRFVWDLRYPGPKTFEGMIFWGAQAEAGPTATPGQYQVRLTANGVSETRPLMVSKDPRLTGVTDADLAEQFKLAIEVRDKTTQANEMVIRIREIKKNIADRVKKDPKLDAAGERLSTKLSAVEEDLYQVRNRSNQDPLNFPIKLNNQIAALMRVIETGDAKPTDQSYVVFKELNDRLEAIRKQFEEILKTDTNGFTAVDRK
jgi:hypothetical protein